jgi:hypothetical protein
MKVTDLSKFYDTVPLKRRKQKVKYLSNYRKASHIKNAKLREIKTRKWAHANTQWDVKYLPNLNGE